MTALAVLMSVLFVWPQAIRLLSTRDVRGVSAGTWTLSLLFFGAWSGFAVLTQFWGLFVANASSFVAAAIIVFVGTRSGWSPRWAALVASGLVAVAVATVFARPALSLLMVASGVVSRIPQIATLLRTSTVSGVSATTWWLSAATTGCWLVVGWTRGTEVVVIASAAALLATLCLLSGLYWRRMTEAQT